MESQKWVKVGKVMGDTQCGVPGLEPGKKYKFRVKAVNSEGESEPLVNENEILAKDPYGLCELDSRLLLFDYLPPSDYPIGEVGAILRLCIVTVDSTEGKMNCSNRENKPSMRGVSCPVR